MNILFKKEFYNIYIFFISVVGISTIIYSLVQDKNNITNYNRGNSEIIVIDLQQKSQINYMLFIGLFLLTASSVLFLIKYYSKNSINNISDDKQTLTVREKEILSLISKRLSNKEISNKLSISMSTVKTHVNNIFRKLNIKKRTELLP